ncbi:MAG: PilZ domain-containing protein [Phycisphaerales bacterium]
MSSSHASTNAFGGQLDPADAQLERRQESRIATEIDAVIAWLHAPQTPMRYRATEYSVHGLRISSVLPVQQGARGKLLATIPHGVVPNGDFEVVWCRKLPARAGGDAIAYEAGCRFDD